MKKATGKLTEAQQAFAAENHELVYDFLRARHLEDDFYDVVILRYLRAVQLYDERPDLRKYQFKTIAFHNMRSALGHHYEKERSLKRNAGVLCFDAPGRTGLPVSETVPGGALVHEYAEIRDMWAQTESALTAKQREIVMLRAQGYRDGEISKALGIAVSSVSGRMFAARQKTRLIREAA